MITQEQNLIYQSAYTFLLLQELRRNDFLNSSYFEDLSFNNPKLKESICKITIDNQGTALFGLYALLVVPRELFEEEYDGFNKSEQYELINNFLKDHTQNTFTSYESDKKEINFIRHIRNAVAHANIAFSPYDSIHFSDFDSRANAEFSTQLSLENLGKLLTNLLSILDVYANEVNK